MSRGAWRPEANVTRVLWPLCEDDMMAEDKDGSMEISEESAAVVLMRRHAETRDGGGGDGGGWSGSGCTLKVEPSGLDEG